MVLDGTASIPPRSRTLAKAIFFVLTFTYAYFYQCGNHNQNARLDQIRSIVEFHSLRINHLQGNTADIITRPDQPVPGAAGPFAVYPVAPPGSTFWGVPFWAFARGLVGVTSLADWKKVTWAHYLTNVLAIAVPSALGAVLFFFWLLEAGTDQSVAFILTLTISLASPILPYSTIYYPHVLSAWSLFASFVLSWKRSRGSNSPDWHPLMAGLLLAYPSLLEYPGLFPGLWLLIYALITFPSRRERLLLLAGALIPALILAAYNYALSEHVLYITHMDMARAGTPYAHHRRGLLGVIWPDVTVLKGVLWGAERGLMMVSPWAILGPVGLVAMIRDKKWRREGILFSVLFFGQVLFNSCLGSSFSLWGGGHAVGPRHLILVLPFLAAALAFLPVRLHVLTSIGAAWGAFVLLAATAVNPMIPYGFTNPIFQYALLGLKNGLLAIREEFTFTNVAMIPGSLSWNWGKLFGWPGWSQLLPVALAWTALAWAAVWADPTSNPQSPRSGGRKE